MTAGTFTAPDEAAEPRSLDLRECWHIVRRRWVLVLAATLVGAIAAAGYAVTSGHKYAATSQVVSPPSPLHPARPARRHRPVPQST